MEERNKRSFGNTGETIAADYLVQNGFNILQRNFRVGRLGEIDIIAQECEYICFIEVKTRSSTFFGMPSEAVNWKKQESIRKLAQVYMKQNGLMNGMIRFDVVEVLMKKTQISFKLESINLIRNAF